MPTQYASHDELSRMLHAFGQPQHRAARWGMPHGDMNFRLALADMLNDLGREEEAGLVGSGRHVMVDPTSFDQRILPARPSFQHVSRALADLGRAQIDHGMADEILNPESWFDFRYDPRTWHASAREGLSGDEAYQGHIDQLPPGLAGWLHDVFPYWHRVAQDQGFGEELPPPEYFHPLIDAVGRAPITSEEDYNCHGRSTRYDFLTGGLADDIPASAFDPEQVRRGAAVEREHTSDPRLAREIARDHLAEHPDYYPRLKAAHLQRYGDAEDEQAFRQKISEDPLELTSHGAFADWLGDRGRANEEEQRRVLMGGLQRRMQTPFTPPHTEVTHPWLPHVAWMQTPGSHAPSGRIPSEPYWFHDRSGAYAIGRHPALTLPQFTFPAGMNPGDWIWYETPGGAVPVHNGEELAQALGVPPGESLDDYTISGWRDRRTPGWTADMRRTPHPDVLQPGERLLWGIDDVNAMDPRHWGQVEQAFQRQWNRGLKRFSGDGWPTAYDEAPVDYGPDEERLGFETRIQDDPRDATQHGVYADWLEEQGLGHEAEIRKSFANYLDQIKGMGPPKESSPFGGLRGIENLWRLYLRIWNQLRGNLNPPQPERREVPEDWGVWSAEGHPTNYARRYDPDELTSLLNTVREDPADWNARGVLGDWLEEHAPFLTSQRSLDFLRRPEGRGWARFLANSDQGNWGHPVWPFGRVWTGEAPTIPDILQRHAGRNIIAGMTPEQIWDGRHATGPVYLPETLAHGPGGSFFVSRALTAPEGRAGTGEMVPNYSVWGERIDSRSPGWGEGRPQRWRFDPWDMATDLRVHGPTYGNVFTLEDQTAKADRRASFIPSWHPEGQDRPADEPRPFARYQDGDPSVHYATGHLQARHLHPDIRGTSLGTALNLMGASEDPRDTQAMLARAILDSGFVGPNRFDAHSPGIELTPLHELADFMLEHPDAPYAGRFNWLTVPESLRRDLVLRRVMKAHGVSPDDVNNFEWPYHDALRQMREGRLGHLQETYPDGTLLAMRDWEREFSGSPLGWFSHSDWRVTNQAEMNRLLERPNSMPQGVRRRSPDPIYDPAQLLLTPWWQDDLREDHPDRYSFDTDRLRQ